MLLLNSRIIGAVFVTTMLGVAASSAMGQICATDNVSVTARVGVQDCDNITEIELKALGDTAARLAQSNATCPATCTASATVSPPTAPDSCDREPPSTQLVFDYRDPNWQAMVVSFPEGIMPSNELQAALALSDPWFDMGGMATLKDFLDLLRTKPDSDSRKFLTGIIAGTGPAVPAAFGASVLGGGECPLQETVRTSWPLNSQLLVRHELDIRQFLGNPNVSLQISWAMDNDLVNLFFARHELATNNVHGACPRLNEFTVPVTAELVTEVLTTGTLQPFVGFHLVDRGVESFFDAKVEAIVASEHSVASWGTSVPVSCIQQPGMCTGCVCGEQGVEGITAFSLEGCNKVPCTDIDGVDRTLSCDGISFNEPS